jgi:hypothetical protein
MSKPLQAEDFMDEAESAERAEAWPQAAALWGRAVELCRLPGETLPGGHYTVPGGNPRRYGAGFDCPEDHGHPDAGDPEVRQPRLPRGGCLGGPEGAAAGVSDGA